MQSNQPYWHAPPGAAPEMPGPLPQAVPPGKPRGRVRKIFGVLLILIGVVPLLGAGFTVFKNFQNAAQRDSNDAFIPAAWHNMASDELFPDRLTWITTAGTHQLWVRQGIAEKADSCEDTFTEYLVRKALKDRCKLVLRATYTDLGSEMTATIGLVVAGSVDDALSIASSIERGQSEASNSLRVPTVRPLAVPGTPAAEWSDDMAFGGAAQKLFTAGSPYLVAVTTGPTDSARSVGELPEPWDVMAHREKQPYRSMAEALAWVYAEDLDRRMRGK
ncbi:hypothetical protein [Streptomyces sp. NPDC006134]|uniref:hypothetical protein n=1 Tax=Streptomyces sp. NPDC006134 TaxID=3154467 RepID=UPI0033FE415A